MKTQSEKQTLKSSLKTGGALKNLDFKNENDAIKYLIDGGMFYDDDGKIYYFNRDSLTIKRKDEITHVYETLVLQQLLIKLNEFSSEMTWQDYIAELPENNVLCWVSNDVAGDRSYALRINGINEIGLFVDVDGIQWSFATPVLSNECWD